MRSKLAKNRTRQIQFCRIYYPNNTRETQENTVHHCSRTTFNKERTLISTSSWWSRTNVHFFSFFFLHAFDHRMLHFIVRLYWFPIRKVNAIPILISNISFTAYWRFSGYVIHHSMAFATSGAFKMFIYGRHYRLLSRLCWQRHR